MPAFVPYWRAGRGTRTFPFPCAVPRGEDLDEEEGWEDEDEWEEEWEEEEEEGWEEDEWEEEFEDELAHKPRRPGWD